MSASHLLWIKAEIRPHYLRPQAGITMPLRLFFPHTNGRGLRPRFYLCQLGSGSLLTPSGGFFDTVPELCNCTVPYIIYHYLCFASPGFIYRPPVLVSSSLPASSFSPRLLWLLIKACSFTTHKPPALNLFDSGPQTTVTCSFLPSDSISQALFFIRTNYLALHSKSECRRGVTLIRLCFQLQPFSYAHIWVPRDDVCHKKESHLDVDIT